MIRTLCFCLAVALATSVLYAAEEDTSPDQLPEDQSKDVGALLRRPILDSAIPLKEMRAYAQSHLLPMPRVSTVQQWEAYAQGLRQQVLERVVLRGKAKEWDRQPLRIKWLESIEGGPGYRIRKLRYEAVPGLWIPALLYEPAELSGPVPVILNVNGHDGNGKSADYKQIRCINEAKRGMLALNVEWLGMGQLKKPNYLHLTALRAPRPTLLTYNAADDCCFRADHALPPLLDAAQPVFDLYGKPGHLRSHINHDPGTHNFFLDNRQQFYRMLGDFFYPGDPDFDSIEILSDDEVKTAEELAVALPEENADFQSLALALSRNLPCGARRPAQRDAALAWQEEQRGVLERVVRAVPYHVRATVYDRHPIDGGQVTFWWLRVGMDCTLPAVELTPPDPTSTVLLVADDGRKSVAAQAMGSEDCLA